jgi:hypothetical protein
MQTRFRAAATALLLTATAGAAAAAGGPAEASGTHANHRAAQLVVTIKTTKSAPKLSTDKIRPGNTTFKVVRHGSGGLIQVLRLKSGYTLKQAAKDFGAAFGNKPDVAAIRRIDKKVVFYGGMPTPAKGQTAKWAVNIDKAGKYYVLNFDKNNLSTFKAKGSHQKRAFPGKDGWINPATASDGVTNIWTAGTHNANKGWMNTTNKAKEPHFVVLDKVKKNTTNQDVQDFFDNGAQGQPPFFVTPPVEFDTGVISPGHTFRWAYHSSKGKYLITCFWPSKMDGTPHAFMGMWKLTTLS